MGRGTCRERKKDPSYQILIIRHDVSRRGAFRLHFNSFVCFIDFLSIFLFLISFFSSNKLEETNNLIVCLFQLVGGKK